MESDAAYTRVAMRHATLATINHHLAQWRERETA